MGRASKHQDLFLFFTGGDRNPQLSGWRAVRTRFPPIPCSHAPALGPPGCSRCPRVTCGCRAPRPALGSLASAASAPRWGDGGMLLAGQRHVQTAHPACKVPPASVVPSHTPTAPPGARGEAKVYGKAWSFLCLPLEQALPRVFTSTCPPSPNRKFMETLLSP